MFVRRYFFHLICMITKELKISRLSVSYLPTQKVSESFFKSFLIVRSGIFRSSLKKLSIQNGEYFMMKKIKWRLVVFKYIIL